MHSSHHRSRNLRHAVRGCQVGRGRAGCRAHGRGCPAESMCDLRPEAVRVIWIHVLLPSFSPLLSLRQLYCPYLCRSWRRTKVARKFCDQISAYTRLCEIRVPQLAHSLCNRLRSAIARPFSAASAHITLEAHTHKQSRHTRQLTHIS